MTASNDSDLHLAISDTRDLIASVEAGITELENSIPEVGTLEFRLRSNQAAITGTRVQIRMDREYLAQARGDLRRLERVAQQRAA